jgi:hypothetical protein
MTSVTLYTLMTLSFDWLACLGAATLSWPHPANLGLGLAWIGQCDVRRRT